MKHLERRALTLTELVLAMAFTAVVALAVAGVTVALANAYRTTDGLYQSLQTGRATMMNLQAAIRSSKLITAAGDEGLVLWRDDTNDDGLINRSEILVLAYSPDDREVAEYRVIFPEDMDPVVREALDVVHPLQSLLDLQATQLWMETAPYVRRLVLATDVGRFSVAAAPDAPLGNLLKIDMEVGQGASVMCLRSACSIRADAIKRIDEINGQFVLFGHGG